ncbi:MAG TPA: type II toxin-antitoxin system RelE/ParE family toxin [Anaerolineales bacterium]|nr:type II toxin-antitoxin system RelE/ParE family toxin [Anaerolineales bacterium]
MGHEFSNEGASVRVFVSNSWTGCYFVRYGMGVYSKEATKSLQRIPRNTAQLIREKLETIAADPYAYADHPNAKKLQGREGYRLRVGDWRILYKIENEQLMIIVLKVASGGEVYK